MARILKKSYLLVKIDTDRMTNGEEVAKRLRKGEGGGIPWMVILDGKGTALINSDGPGGKGMDYTLSLRRPPPDADSGLE